VRTVEHGADEHVPSVGNAGGAKQPEVGRQVAVYVGAEKHELRAAGKLDTDGVVRNFATMEMPIEDRIRIDTPAQVVLDKDIISVDPAGCACGFESIARHSIDGYFV